VENDDATAVPLSFPLAAGNPPTWINFGRVSVQAPVELQSGQVVAFFCSGVGPGPYRAATWVVGLLFDQGRNRDS